MSNEVNIKDYNYKRTVEFLQSFLKESCKFTFNRYCKIASLTLIDVTEEPNETSVAFTEEMSMIVLWGSLGTIILKSHFN